MLKTIDEYKIFIGKNVLLISDLTNLIISNVKKQPINNLNNHNFIYHQNPRIFINQNWEEITKFFNLNNKYSIEFIAKLKDTLLYLFETW